MGALSSLEGSVIAGRFELGALLGQGGYGAVYEGTQLSIKRVCAIKIMELGEQAPEQVVKRFKAEAVLTSRLSHPNSVVIYDYGEDAARGVFFIAMEHLKGDDLNTILREQGPMALEDAVHVVEQIAASLEDAHDRGVIHRDIKPHNVMIVPSSRDPLFVKVIDFGIAKVMKNASISTMERLTRTGTMVGTPHYMAPEQIRDEAVDGRTDTYSLGMCLYKMLTGRTPFAGGSPVDVACRQLTDRALPLSSYRHDLDVPPAFEDALARAIEKDADARFESVQDFAQALRGALAGHVQTEVGAASRARLEQADTAEETVETREAGGAEVATTVLSGDQLAERAAADAASRAVATAAAAAVAEVAAGDEQTRRPNQRSTMLLFPMSATEIERHAATLEADTSADPVGEAPAETRPEPTPPSAAPRVASRVQFVTSPQTPTALQATPRPSASPDASSSAAPREEREEVGALAPPIPSTPPPAGVPVVIWIALVSSVLLLMALTIALIMT